MRNCEDWSAQTYAEAEGAIGYVFRNKNLLIEAFTHKSFSNFKSGAVNNERLEHLGDSVLQLCVTEELYRHTNGDEGKLTDLRQKYVSREPLERAAERAGLMKFLRYSGGESNLGGKTPSNLFEAVVAAIYLDGKTRSEGLKNVRKFLARYLEKIEELNYKTLLQEFVQERIQELPVYTQISGGNGVFYCSVSALGESAEGSGQTKQAAEKQAAKALYQILSKGTNL